MLNIVFIITMANPEMCNWPTESTKNMGKSDILALPINNFMRKILAAGLLTILCLFAHAQITFNSGDLPVAPTVLNNGVDTMPSGITPGQAGANRTWNFTVVTQHITETSTHQTAAASGYSADFPTATNAITPNGNSYGFFRNTSSAFTAQGLAGDLLNNGNIIVVNFNPTFDLYRFPTQYGNNFGGTYGFQETVPGSAVGQPVHEVRLTFTSTYTDTIDGWGTTVTPIGSYNTLRQKRVDRSYTKIEVKLFSFSNWSTFDEIYDTATSYNYLSIDTKGPVVTLGTTGGQVTRVTWSLTPPATPAPIANFTYNNPYGGFVQFTDQSQNNPTTYSWDFGDGSPTSSQQNPSHTYAANNTYTVCLTVTNAGGSDTQCQPVLVDGIFNTTMTGPTTLCNDETSGNTYNTTNTAGHTYTWSVTGGSVTSGAGTNSVVVDFTGNAPYSVQVIECEGTGNFCDTATTLVTIYPANNTTINRTVCAGDSFDGYNTSGTFTDTYSDFRGCDSTRTLNLTVLPVNATTVTRSICPGSSYEGYSTAGTYTDVFTDYRSCDSTRTLILSVQSNIVDSLELDICFGDTYYGYSANGTYLDTFSSTGCDSVRVLFLTVLPQNTSTVSETICQGDSYAGYTSAGTYTDTYQDYRGCDSIRTLNLTVLPNSQTIIDTTICFGNTFESYGANGTYYDTLSAANTCDSVRIINLTVLPQNINTISESICQGDSFEGYSAGGTYTDVFTAADGCDSTRVLNLTVLPNAITTVFDTICEGDTLNGYYTTGVYNDTLTAANTCDSIHSLNLTVITQGTTTINEAICAGDSIWLEGEWQTTAGTYTDTISAGACTEIRVTNLVINPLPSVPAITQNGTKLSIDDAYSQYDWYLDGALVDSAGGFALNITNTGDYVVVVTDTNGCTTSSAVYTVTTIGINESDVFAGFKYYPNPNTGLLYLEADRPAEVALLNGLGQVVYITTVTNNTHNIDMAHLSEGIYFLKVRMENRTQVFKVLLAK